MSSEINYKSLGRRRILLVEDVEINQYLARHIMESWGFDVMVAANGRQAVSLVQQQKFDLVLMDIQMPEMDGVEATRLIRQFPDKTISSIPIVALTANVSKADSERYAAVGMNGYLAKPYTEDKLFMKIAEHLGAGNGVSATVQKVQPVESMAVEKLYDLAMVETIAGGDETFVKKMMQLFLDTMPQTLQELQAQLASQSWEAVGKLAHKMKSTIDSMGINMLKEDIRSIESNGKNKQNLDQMQALVANVVSVMERCMMQIKANYSL